MRRSEQKGYVLEDTSEKEDKNQGEVTCVGMEMRERKCTREGGREEEGERVGERERQEESERERERKSKHTRVGGEGVGERER